MRTIDPILKSWLEVLNGNMHRVPLGIQIGNDRLKSPVAVPVNDDIAAGRPSRNKSEIAVVTSSADSPSHGPTPTARQRARRRCSSSTGVNLPGSLQGVLKFIDPSWSRRAHGRQQRWFPGVSGGTLALIVGIYQTLINAIADLVLSVRQLVGLAPGKASSKAAASNFHVAAMAPPDPSCRSGWARP